MKIIIVSATQNEINPIIRYYGNSEMPVNLQSTSKTGENQISFLITGIGIISTAYQLTKILTKQKFDLILNAGIAGTFNDNIAIGDVVNVTTEEFGDFGIDDNNRFKTVFDKKLILPDYPPFVKGKLPNIYPGGFNSKILKTLPRVKGLTVNTVSGNKDNIVKLKRKFDSDIETMEGAAFFFVAINENIPFLQIRSISNKVEHRDFSKWNVPLAIKNLNQTITGILQELF